MYSSVVMTQLYFYYKNKKFKGHLYFTEHNSSLIFWGHHVNIMVAAAASGCPTIFDPQNWSFVRGRL